MKKILILLLAIFLLLSFAACTDKEEKTTEPDTAETVTQEVPSLPEWTGDISPENRTEDGTIVTPILPFDR